MGPLSLRLELPVWVLLCKTTQETFGAMTKRVQLPSSPTVVEALACRRALFFAKEL